MATDKKRAYALLIYEKELDVNSEQLEKIGFYSGKYIPNSCHCMFSPGLLDGIRTKQFNTTNFPQMSNIGIPGVYVFQVFETEIRDPSKHFNKHIVFFKFFCSSL